MAPVGIGLGLFIGLALAAFIGEVVLPDDKTAGILPGLVVAAWVAWPFIDQFRVSRYNLLHPVPRQYKQTITHAFSQIRDLLADTTYNLGDKWQVVTADTKTRRIMANLRFTDKETQMEGDARGQLHTKDVRYQRLIELEALLQEAPGDSVIVQLNFRPTMEGGNYQACDPIISQVRTKIEQLLGPGTDSGEPAGTRIAAPHWALIALAALALISLNNSVFKHLGEISNKVTSEPGQIAQSKKDAETEDQSRQRELEAWAQFKQSRNLQ
jgi:hypothetical protein